MCMPAAYSAGTLPGKIDPRVKVVSIFGFVAVVSSLTSKPLLLSAACLLLLLALFSRSGITSLLRRVALVLPFTGAVLILFPFILPGEVFFSLHLGPVTLAATHEGVSRAATLSLRVLTAVLAVSMLTATTPFPDLMQALRQLRIPGIFVQILEFTLRYIFVLADEVRRMRVARRSRCFENGKSILNLDTFRTLGQLVGVLFMRSWDRGERIYSAMLARGYSADSYLKAQGSTPGWGDLAWGAGVLVAAVSLRVLEIYRI